MGTEAEAFERNVLRRLVYAPNHGGFVLQLRSFGGDESEHHVLALGHIGQRCEAARAFVVEFEVEGVYLLKCKERFRHRIVGTLERPVGMIVAAAHVGGNRHAFRTIFEGQIVQAQARGLQQSGIDVRSEDFVEVVAAVSTPSAVVQLDIAAARSSKVADHGAISGTNVLNQLFVVGIDGRCCLGIVAAEQFGVELCGRRQGLSCHHTWAFKLLDELEVLDKGVVFAADFPGESARSACGFDFVELVTVFQLDAFHALETPGEIEVPIAASELSVGDHLEACGELVLDERGDALVFHLFELGGIDLSGGKAGTGFVQTCGAEEAADDIGAVGGEKLAHVYFSFCDLTLMFRWCKGSAPHFHQQIISAIQKNMLHLPKIAAFCSKSFSEIRKSQDGKIRSHGH